MAREEKRQRLSFMGMVGIVALAGLTWRLVGSGNLLILYFLACGSLIAILLVVAFDLGLGKSGQASQEEPQRAETAVIGQAPSPKANKSPTPRRSKRRTRAA